MPTWLESRVVNDEVFYTRDRRAYHIYQIFTPRPAESDAGPVFGDILLISEGTIVREVVDGHGFSRDGTQCLLPVPTPLRAPRDERIWREVLVNRILLLTQQVEALTARVQGLETRLRDGLVTEMTSDLASLDQMFRTVLENPGPPPPETAPELPPPTRFERLGD